jgi:hypothetical protein
MELFKNIRLNIGYSILKNKVAITKRKSYYSSISQVKNIGIVWNAARIEDFSFLSRFYQTMHENKTEVKIIGYFNGKNLPNQYTAIRYLSVIKKDELDFFYRPLSREVNSFVNNKFDVLIDINFEKLFPLRYISSLSNAGLKVGLLEADSSNAPFDLMMDIKNPINVEDYIKQVMHYLEMITSGSVKKAD